MTRSRLGVLATLGALSAFGPLSLDLYLPGLPELTRAAVELVGTVATGGALAPLLLGLFPVVASIGLVLPNTTALGLARARRSAGSASAVLGFRQYSVGAVVPPLVTRASARTGVTTIAVSAGLGPVLLRLARDPAAPPLPGAAAALGPV